MGACMFGVTLCYVVILLLFGGYHYWREGVVL